MQQVKQVATGFTLMSSAVCFFLTFFMIKSGYLVFWIGVPLFVLLAASFAFSCYRLVKNGGSSNPPERQVKQAKAILMGLVGVGGSCWFLDVLTTFFAINVNQVATELNPLGWPYSAFVALAYYIPITFAMYYLLYKVKKKWPFYAALVISFATLVFGAMSLIAALWNLSSAFPYDTVGNLWIVCIWSALLICLTSLNFANAKAR